MFILFLRYMILFTIIINQQTETVIRSYYTIILCQRKVKVCIMVKDENHYRSILTPSGSYL